MGIKSSKDKSAENIIINLQSDAISKTGKVSTAQMADLEKTEYQKCPERFKLLKACRCKLDKTAIYILDNEQPNINFKYSVNNNTALIYAVDNCMQNVVTKLLEMKADPNIVNTKKRTAIYYAICRLCDDDTAKIYDDIAMTLAQHGADIGDSHYITFALRSKLWNFARLLLTKMDCTVGINKYAAILMAERKPVTTKYCVSGKIVPVSSYDIFASIPDDIFEKIICQIDFNAVNKSGLSFVFAVHIDHIELAKKIINIIQNNHLNFDPNIIHVHKRSQRHIDADKYTPDRLTWSATLLSAACKQDEEEFAIQLVKLGADPTLQVCPYMRSKLKDMTPIDFALYNKMDNFIKYIVERGYTI
ncbi:MAG: hypothetical protein Faunusvirus21_5 [Faunusvirus sp.]|jgi:hypothetical protein|uniref:Ankyrin repeat protein n=1 Tax=Faunusvirus sp. TaxID=2487766 RepID=A0A3G4ZZV0_9VIRU|nr:MAG: hypothetical protein Faunusvirus21_5 [Faunusvirus sp.]